MCMKEGTFFKFILTSSSLKANLYSINPGFDGEWCCGGLSDDKVNQSRHVREMKGLCLYP